MYIMSKFFPWVEINLSALAHNLSQIRSVVGKKVKIAAVIKANAYGHGIVETAKFLERSKVDYLCVARISEALQLRESKVKSPILILGHAPAEFFKEIVSHNLTVTITNLEVAKALVTEGRRKNKTVKIHVKVETGMHRIGIETPQILFFLKKLLDLPNLKIEGLYTHFADADNLDLSFTRLQLERFKEVLRELEKAGIRIPLIHAANSAAILQLPESHLQMVRPGMVLYGLNPLPDLYSDEKFERTFNLKPVLSFKTRIIQINYLPAGETIGYGRTYKTLKDAIIGTIAVGYGDGFRRTPQDWGEVLTRGKRCPILGRVAMDACQIDLSAIPQAKVYDEVVLIGQSQDEIMTASEVARKLGSVNYEVVTGIMARVERRYINFKNYK